MLITSFAIKLSKNLLLLINIAEVNKIGIGVSSDDHKDETIGRLLSKNLHKATGYLTSNAR